MPNLKSSRPPQVPLNRPQSEQRIPNSRQEQTLQQYLDQVGPNDTVVRYLIGRIDALEQQLNTLLDEHYILVANQQTQAYRMNTLEQKLIEQNNILSEHQHRLTQQAYSINRLGNEHCKIQRLQKLAQKQIESQAKTIQAQEKMIKSLQKLIKNNQKQLDESHLFSEFDMQMKYDIMQKDIQFPKLQERQTNQHAIKVNSSSIDSKEELRQMKQAEGRGWAFHRINSISLLNSSQ